MATDPIGLYVHIPFCVRKCNYCDFFSGAASEETILRYTDALVEEIKGYEREKKISVDSIFFGGGTPSILPSDQFERIVNAIRASFEIVDNTEFTVEVNPGAVSHEKLLVYNRLGVNRLSIGLQSIHENELKKLGRIHTFADFLETYNISREVGFRNINVDLMYGIPNQTKESFYQTLKTVLEISVEHISCYGLIVEEGTPFFAEKNSLALPSEDEEADMYFMAAGELCRSGYRHYEISNYSKSGKECRHNLKYWRDKEYVGVGASAHSYYNSERYYNVADLNKYISEPSLPIKNASRALRKDPFEYAMLNLRLADGLSLSEYKGIFSEDFTEGKESELEKLINEGYMELEGDLLHFTDKGFYVSNTILSILL